jgi:hypothetical protein
MKTITEFSGFSLKEAIGKKAALLTEGKTEEEAQGVINEQLKLSDDTKIAFYKNAVDMTKSRVDTVKRVVVALKATETETVPTAFMEREGHFYLVEYFGSASTQAPAYGRDGRDGRGGRGGDRGRGGRGGGGRGDGGRSGGGRGDGGGRGRDGGGFSNDRPRREDAAPVVRPEGTFAALKPVDPNAPKPARGPRPPRNDQPRGPRAPRDPNAPRAPREARPPRDNSARGPKGAGELRLVLKGQSTTLQGSGVNTPVVEAAAAPSAE